MIDTVKIRIPVEQNLSDLFKKRSVEVTKKDNSLKEVIFSYHTMFVNVGSWSKKVHLFYNEYKKYITVEFSLPKYRFGHNVYLMYHEEFLDTIKELYTDLVSELDFIPSIDTWSIDRLDLCYAWKFRTQEEAEKVIFVLQKYDYPRHKTYRYDTSIMTVGSNYSTKFYLKNQEFFKHDFPEIKKEDPEKAYQILSLSQGVLRFEVSLKKKALERLFEARYIRINDVYTLDMYNTISTYLNKFLSYGTGEFMNDIEALAKLTSVYSKRKALGLFKFWLMWSSASKKTRDLLKSDSNKSNIYRSIRELKKAKVGFLSDEDLTNLATPIKLSIPSPYSVC